jgi:hypothetical protein
MVPLPSLSVCPVDDIDESSPAIYPYKSYDRNALSSFSTGNNYTQICCRTSHHQPEQTVIVSSQAETLTHNLAIRQPPFKFRG